MKVDLFRADGSYAFSTDRFSTIKRAVEYFKSKEEDVASGLIDHSNALLGQGPGLPNK